MRAAAVIFAVLAGLLTLSGYYVPALGSVQGVVLNWAILVTATATIVGILNLILVHATRIHSREKGAFQSGVLLVSLFAAFVFGLALGPEHAYMQRIVSAIIIPAESSLMALLAVTLLYAGIRLLRRRAGVMSVVFLGTAIVMLVASATLPMVDTGVLHQLVRPWFQQVLALGGARGLLIGIALGTLVTGVRVLVASDRPYEAG